MRRKRRRRRRRSLSRGLILSNTRQLPHIGGIVDGLRALSYTYHLTKLPLTIMDR